MTKDNEGLEAICKIYEEYVMSRATLTQVLQVVNIECMKLRNIKTEQKDSQRE